MAAMARAYYGDEDFTEASMLYAIAIEIVENTDQSSSLSVADWSNSLATLYMKHGHYEGAKDLLIKAIGIWRKHFGNNHQFVALGMASYMNIMRKLGRVEEAEAINSISKEVFKVNPMHSMQ
jgi:tetratricopeptide (TPR) repeat protein